MGLSIIIDHNKRNENGKKKNKKIKENKRCDFSEERERERAKHSETGKKNL